ncbi:hypothetical protein PHMEG_000927 [Phytophthora megakarya]|uniref:Uncharacterized protein n=1 Tax=Phytophthora megakarya TaxID=4795 RepID=A0A225X4C8_9STRA|nr:hypothetical protein PHMEG_000927 [Phytophthora megakarya]
MVQSPKQEHEMPLVQDTEFRRIYLQRIYRQLQSSHPNQDDSALRQFATNMEMETCQKTTTRTQYAELMDQNIHNLMQFEMEQANVYANGVQIQEL